MRVLLMLIAKQTDRQTDKQTDRQTDRHSHHITVQGPGVAVSINDCTDMAMSKLLTRCPRKKTVCVNDIKRTILYSYACLKAL